MANFEMGYMCRNESWDEDEDGFKQFKEVLRNFLKDDMRVVFHNFHSERYHHKIMENQTGLLQIISWAYSDVDVVRSGKHRDKLNSLGLCDDGIFLPLNRDGEVVFYIDDCPLAVYDKSSNIVWLLWDSSHDSTRQMKINGFNTVIKAFEFFAKSGINSDIFICQTPIVTLNKTIDGLKVFAERGMKQMQTELKNGKESVSKMGESLAQQNRRNNELMRKINTINEMSDHRVNIMNKYVKHIAVDSTSIKIYTDHIYITDFDIDSCVNLYDNKYDKDTLKHCTWYIGLFEISINLETLEISFANTNNRRTGKGRGFGGVIMHPHISKNGEACFGDLTEMIAFATSNADMATLIDVLIQYLQSINILDSAGRDVSCWDLIDTRTNTLMENGEVFVEPEWCIPQKMEVS